MNPYTFKSLPFDVERDFVPVINIGISPFMIAVNPALPVNSMAELIVFAQANPGKLSFATSGARNLQHITGEMLKLRSGINIVNVPYKGSPFAAQDTIAGRTPTIDISSLSGSRFSEGRTFGSVWGPGNRA